MKKIYNFLHLLALAGILAGCSENKKQEAASADSSQTNQTNKPNIVVIIADDLGWNDISANGNQEIPTPNIDAIGKEGVRFTQGYATAPICGPSRAGLITGRYQQRFGQEFQIHGKVKNPAEAKPIPGGYIEAYLPQNYDSNAQGLPVDEITLAALLKENGYRTGLVGKWHLGYEEQYKPLNRGFDTHFGFLGGGSLYGDTADETIVHKHLDWVSSKKGLNREEDRAILSNGKVVEVKEYLTGRFAKEAVNFIEENRNKPFYLHLTFNAPHTPVQAPKTYYDRFANIKDENKRTYYAMIAALDDVVGEVNAKLKELNLDKNTIVFFVGDNGGASYTRLTDNAPLKGGKLTHYEGGVRVPFFVKWPEKIKAGQVYDKPVISLDIFTTVAKAAGATLPDKKYDGINLVDYVNGANDKTPHEALFWRSGYAKAVRKGDLKLIVNTEKETRKLYNIKTDPSETKDLAKEKPEAVKDLEATLTQWESELKTPLWKSWRKGRVKINEKENYNSPL